MSIQVRYFASMRERMGRDGDVVGADSVATVQDVWSRVAAGKPLPANTLIAVNMEYGRLHDTVKEGDEIAFFPPVTGG